MFNSQRITKNLINLLSFLNMKILIYFSTNIIFWKYEADIKDWFTVYNLSLIQLPLITGKCIGWEGVRVS